MTRRSSGRYPGIPCNVSRVVILEIQRTRNPDLRARMMELLSEHAMEVLPDDDLAEVKELSSRYVEGTVG